MDLIIIANFCRDLSETDNVRFLYLCKMLAVKHNVELITSDFIHGKKKHREQFQNKFPFTITFLHEPGYRKNISIKRFFSHRLWGMQVKKYLEKRKKPDAIYCAVPSLTAPAVAADYCMQNHVRFIIDVQDLWPEAFQMVFNPPVLNRFIYLPFKHVADHIYSSADEIIAVSRTYIERAMSVNSKCKEGHAVFLGTDLATFDKNALNNPVVKPDNQIWLAYCGTLGASYDLTSVFDALDIVKKRGIIPPKFVVMGDGPRKEEFENYARAKNVDVHFTGWIPYDQMCGMLCACDITVNPITDGAAQSIINKHADYAAAGLPVLNTQQCQEYCDLVEQYRMGFNCKNNDAVDLADHLIKLLQNEQLRRDMGDNARKCAREKFDRQKSYQIINMILSEK